MSLNKNERNRFFSQLIICLLLTVLLFLSMMPEVSAGGQDATFDSIDVRAIPPVQGVGGDVQIEVSAHFFGGCCYHLYAKDVKAELTVPDDVQIKGAALQSIGTVDAVPGGKATSARFYWTIISDSPGTYNLNAKVSTSNCGTQSNYCEITIVEGASISNPTIFPSKPSVGEKITFSAVVRSGSQHADVSATTIYIWRSEKEYSQDTLLAEEKRLYKVIGGSISNQTQNQTTNTDENIQKELLGEGKAYDMSQVHSNMWLTQIDDFDKEEQIYYWFYVETTDGKNSSSFVYKLDLEDLEKKYQTLNHIIWGTFIAISLGLIMILGISWAYMNKPVRDIGKSGIFILGSDSYSKPSEGKRANIFYLSISKFRIFLLILFIILAVILIIISIYLGLFQALITETGG